MALAIDIMVGRGLSNKVRREHLPNECYISRSFHSRRRCSIHGKTRNKKECYSGAHSKAFKDKARLQLHSKNFDLKQVLFVRY